MGATVTAMKPLFLEEGIGGWSHSKIIFPWNYKYFRRTWRCCKDFDLNIHFKSVNENQWHNNFMIVHLTLPLFRFSSNELYTIYWDKNSVMSETILCILRLRPRLSDSSLKIWDWDWDSRNQSHILRLILRLWPFGLKKWDWDWDFDASVSKLETETETTLVSVSVSRPKSRSSLR